MTDLRCSSIEVGVDEWLVHVNAWMIEDGNYPDLEIGSIVHAALQFEAGPIQDAGTAPPSMQRRAGDYRVVAPLRQIRGKVWILEGGPSAYAERLEWEGDGERVSMTARLFLDPFPFREVLGRLPGVPAIDYNWRVTGIWKHLSPNAPASIGEDFDIEPIERTDAIRDNGGTAVYVLRAHRESQR